MDIFRSGRPNESTISLITEKNSPSVQRVLLEYEPERAGNYQDVLERISFENRPAFSALAFTLSTGWASLFQAFSWGYFGCIKVSTLVGGFAGGILGGACGFLKAGQLRLAGEESQSFTKNIRDYAIRGKSVGTVYSFYLSVLPAICLGIKVTLVAMPVLNITVPLSTALAALSGVEFAYRGNRSIGYRLIDKVFEYTLPSKYIPKLEKDIQMADREREVPLYPNLKTTDMTPGLQHPLPRSAVLCVSPAESHEKGITEQENYHVYDYEALRSAFLNDENFVFPHNGEPVNWGLVFRMPNHNLQ